MTVTYTLTRNQNVNGINYTFLSSDRDASGVLNIDLLTSDHELHGSANIQTRMDQGVASFNITDAHLTALLPTYNGSPITLNIIIEKLATNNDPNASIVLYNEIIVVEPGFNAPDAPVLSLNQDNDEYSLLNVTVPSSNIINHFTVFYKSDVVGSKYQKLTYTLSSDTNILGVETVGSNKVYILRLPNLTNGHQYEAYVTAYNQYGDSGQSGTIELTPLNIPNAPVITKVETIMGEGFSPHSVEITVKWVDNDAESYWSVDASRNRLASSAESYAKLRIGTASAIEAGKLSYNSYDASYAFEIVLTNAQLTDAKNLSVDPSGVIITTPVNMVDWFGLATAITVGGSLQAQIVGDSNPYDPSGNPALFGDRDMGELSAEKRAYLQVDAVLSDILVSVNLGGGVNDGEQTFYFNGEIPSKDTTGVSLTVWNDVSYNPSNKIINAEQVHMNGSSTNMNEQFVAQTYGQITTGNYITATLSVPDRNGTRDVNNDVIVYTYSKTFETSKFKTPTNESTFNFTGNKGHDDDYLHTVLTDVYTDTDNKFDSDTTRVNVTWKLFDDAVKAAADDETPLVSASYSAVGGTIEDISAPEGGFDLTASYYLKVTKSCALASGIVSNYNLHYYGEDTLEFHTYDLHTAVNGGPIFYMQNPVLSAIKVNVDVATGEQTFFFNGQIASENATGATLTVTNSSNSTSITNKSVVLSGATIQEETCVIVYDNIATDNVITATLTQQDRNGTEISAGTKYTYVSDVSFVTYKFKTPAAPSATLAKNLVGNDRTFKATLTDASANNGYAITTLTAQISSAGAGTGGLLADCSGTFDLDVSLINQPLDLTRAAAFEVDYAYYMDVTKSYSLNSTVYNRYLDASNGGPLAQTGSIHMSPYAGPVYYMGNPEITAIDITVPGTVKITAETHGTTLTSDKAFTLVMVAKDGLDGYANGSNLGPMGTEVLTNGTSSFNTTSTVNENAVVDYTFTTAATITTAASCIGIVDVTNGHSAVSLLNFPNVPLEANFNNKNN